jgi:RecB family exonuclease
MTGSVAATEAAPRAEAARPDAGRAEPGRGDSGAPPLLSEWFADAPESGYDVVDWKTGRPPASDAERRAVSVQLAAYRLAWAALAGVPVAQVRAAFHYVAAEVTVRPADLLDEAGLTALISRIPAEAR